MEIFKNGAKYLRFDSHLHTMADKEFKYDNTNHDFIKNYIQKLKDENIKVGIITNHNKFDKDEFVNLKKQAQREEILLIPGTELSVKEGKNGIHVLIAFSNDWIGSGKDNINTFLDSVFIGISNKENENTRCREDLTGVIQLLDNFNLDYFIILAHVDNNSGLFNECEGGLIKSLFSNEKIKSRVLGIQKSTNRDNYKNFVEWTNKELARVEGSDPKKIEDIEKLLNEKSNIENSIKQKTTELEELSNEYKKIKATFISEFENVKRELNLKENLDGDTYLKLKQQLDAVNNDIDKMEKELKNKEKLRKELIKLFKKRRELITEDNNKYLNYIEGINSNQDNIKIEFIVNGNKAKFSEDLKDELKKTNITKNTFTEIADNFIDYLGILEDILLNDANNLKDISGANIIEKIKERFIKDIDDICKYTPNNKIIIKYHDKNIENYSLGQRASAVLLFILAQYDNDVIMIDQPEDDMDNQVIYKELIKTIKKAKENIQFIFTTHNPNIPVLGDAEEIIGLKDEDGLTIDNDSIDNEVIQKDIVEIMEGGQEAFQRREKIYNEWNSN